MNLRDKIAAGLREAKDRLSGHMAGPAAAQPAYQYAPAVVQQAPFNTYGNGNCPCFDCSFSYVHARLVMLGARSAATLRCHIDKHLLLVCYTWDIEVKICAIYQPAEMHSATASTSSVVFSVSTLFNMYQHNESRLLKVLSCYRLFSSSCCTNAAACAGGPLGLLFS